MHACYSIPLNLNQQPSSSCLIKLVDHHIRAQLGMFVMFAKFNLSTYLLFQVRYRSWTVSYLCGKKPWIFAFRILFMIADQRHVDSGFLIDVLPSVSVLV